MIGLVDQLVILLSTDWFKDHWPVIGIDLDSSSNLPIREGCREIVRQIVSGAREYWLADLSDERRWETQLMLEKLVKRLNLERFTLDTISEWTEARNEDIDVGALYFSFTEELFSDDIPISGPQLDHEIKGIMSRSIAALGHHDSDFEGLNLNSNSTWDRYIRALTPELPTSISDTLRVFVKARCFRKFWYATRETLTSLQEEELISWYRAMAKSQAGSNTILEYMN